MNQALSNKIFWKEDRPSLVPKLTDFANKRQAA